MRWPANLEGLWEKEKAQGIFQQMGMDYYLARTEKALEKLRSVGKGG